MAIPTSKNLAHDEFRKMIVDHGRDTPATEFLNGDVLQASCVISNELTFDHRDYEYAKEHAAKSTVGKVAAACPKMCANCGALEMRGEFRSNSMLTGVTVKVSARCTSAGYCPKLARVSHVEEFNREYMLSFPKHDPSRSYFPDPATFTTHSESAANGLLADEMQKIANQTLGKQRVVEPKSPQSTPKTKPDLVW